MLAYVVALVIPSERYRMEISVGKRVTVTAMAVVFG